MKGLTQTVILAVVLAGLGGYIYFVEMKKPPVETATKEKAFTVNGDDIEELSVKAADGETTRLKKTSNGWQLTEPVKADADATEPQNITQGLSNVEIERVVDENPGSLKDFGLDPPRMDVGFRAKADKDLKHLLIGDKTATGGELYAMRQGDKRLLLVSATNDNTFNHGTFALRDKSVLKFDRGKVDTIEIVDGSKTLALRKAGDVEWNIEKPIALRGDFGAIDGLLNSLTSTQVQKFLDGETDLAKYGLAKPVVTATVKGGGTQTSLMFGKAENGTRYAKDISRPLIFTVGENLMKDLQKSPTDLRRKDVFDSRPYTATRYEFKRGTDVISIEKAKNAKGEEVWKNNAGKELETEKAADPLQKLANLRADTIEAAAPAGAKPSELTVTVKFDEGKKTETVSFARAGSDVYATRDGEPGAAKVPAAAYEDALKAIDNLK